MSDEVLVWLFACLEQVIYMVQLMPLSKYTANPSIEHINVGRKCTLITGRFTYCDGLAGSPGNGTRFAFFNELLIDCALSL